MAIIFVVTNKAYTIIIMVKALEPTKKKSNGIIRAAIEKDKVIVTVLPESHLVVSHFETQG